MKLDLHSIWIVAGMGLLIGEMISGGFFLVFIALGCFGAALAASLGATQAAQIIICALVSVAGVAILRRPLKLRMLRSIAFSADIGKELKLDQPVLPHQQTRITYQGTSWLATNLDAEPLNQGDRVTIVGMDGNVLLIRKID
jgi:inner membrane protein